MYFNKIIFFCLKYVRYLGVYVKCLCAKKRKTLIRKEKYFNTYVLKYVLGHGNWTALSYVLIVHISMI